MVKQIFIISACSGTGGRRNQITFSSPKCDCFKPYFARRDLRAVFYVTEYVREYVLNGDFVYHRGYMYFYLSNLILQIYIKSLIFYVGSNKIFSFVEWQVCFETMF